MKRIICLYLTVILCFSNIYVYAQPKIQPITAVVAYPTPALNRDDVKTQQIVVKDNLNVSSITGTPNLTVGGTLTADVSNMSANNVTVTGGGADTAQIHATDTIHINKAVTASEVTANQGNFANTLIMGQLAFPYGKAIDPTYDQMQWKAITYCTTQDTSGNCSATATRTFLVLASSQPKMCQESVPDTWVTADASTADTCDGDKTTKYTCQGTEKIECTDVWKNTSGSTPKIYTAKAAVRPNNGGFDVCASSLGNWGMPYTSYVDPTRLCSVYCLNAYNNGDCINSYDQEFSCDSISNLPVCSTTQTDQQICDAKGQGYQCVKSNTVSAYNGGKVTFKYCSNMMDDLTPDVLLTGEGTVNYLSCEAPYQKRTVTCCAGTAPTKTACPATCPAGQQRTSVAYQEDGACCKVSDECARPYEYNSFTVSPNQSLGTDACQWLRNTRNITALTAAATPQCPSNYEDDMGPCYIPLIDSTPGQGQGQTRYWLCPQDSPDGYDYQMLFLDSTKNPTCYYNAASGDNSVYGQVMTCKYTPKSDCF